jgi:hypothetical protein
MFRKRREQDEGATPGHLHKPGDLLGHRLGNPGSRGSGKPGRQVERRLGRVVERGRDGELGERRHASPSSSSRPDLPAEVLEGVPVRSVAEVKTTVSTEP